MAEVRIIDTLTQCIRYLGRGRLNCWYRPRLACLEISHSTGSRSSLFLEADADLDDDYPTFPGPLDQRPGQYKERADGTGSLVTSINNGSCGLGLQIDNRIWLATSLMDVTSPKRNMGVTPPISKPVSSLITYPANSQPWLIITHSRNAPLCIGTRLGRAIAALALFLSPSLFLLSPTWTKATRRRRSLMVSLQQILVVDTYLCLFQRAENAPDHYRQVLSATQWHGSCQTPRVSNNSSRFMQPVLCHVLPFNPFPLADAAEHPSSPRLVQRRACSLQASKCMATLMLQITYHVLSTRSILSISPV